MKIARGKLGEQYRDLSDRPKRSSRSGNGSRGVPSYPGSGRMNKLDRLAQRYADLYEFAPISYVTLNRIGRIEGVNLAATTLLGQTRQRLIGSPFAARVVRRDTPLFLRHLLACRASHNPVETGLHLKRADGEGLNVVLSSSPTYSSMKDGAPLYQTAIIDLTESKRAEEAIRRSEQRYRTLFDLVPVAVYACDAKGVIQEFNQRAVGLWGREPRAGNGENEKFCGSYKIYYPDGRLMPHKHCPMARALRGEQLAAKDLEIVVERLDGERRHVVVAPRTLTDDRGKIIGAINCLFDITERKRTEERLAEQARLLDLSNDAILVRDRNDRVTYWSYGATEMYGYLPKEALGKITHKLLRTQPPDVLKLAREKLAKDGRWRGELVHTRKDGTRIVVISRRVMDRDHEGEPASILETNTDISQQKRAEEKIRNSEELHRAMISQTAAAMARIDLSGTFTFVNKKFCELLGYRHEELIGKRIAEIAHPDDVRETENLFKRVAKKGEPYDLEERCVRKDGSTLWVNVSASPMLNGSGKPQSVLAVVIDISARKQAEADLKKSNELLEERVRDRTQELRNTNVELENEIRRRKGLEGQILEISDREQQRLGRELHDGLCQQLTAIGFMARATALRLKNHRVLMTEDVEKLAELLNDAATDARNLARGLHQVDVNAAEFVRAMQDLVNRELWQTPCRLDVKRSFHIEDDAAAGHLFRIAREAVINANKHAQAREIVIKLEHSRKGLFLSVTDDGVGMPTEADKKQGLGFHIMNYRARAAGGRLEVESRKQGGTRIVCCLPN